MRDDGCVPGVKHFLDENTAYSGRWAVRDKQVALPSLLQWVDNHESPYISPTKGQELLYEQLYEVAVNAEIELGTFAPDKKKEESIQ